MMCGAVFLKSMFVVAVFLICSVAKIASARAALVNNAIRVSALTANLIAAPLTGENNAA
jgi:hypothetical protein